MRRPELVPLAIVAALIAFVGVQIARAPRPTARDERPSSIPASDTQSPTAGSREPGAFASGDTRQSVAPSTERAPVRDLTDLRSRIVSGAPGTYLADLLASQDSTLYRWSDRRIAGLRVWVQDHGTVADWSPEYTQMARDVFLEWGSAGSPLRFDFARDSAMAEITVAWVDRFEDRRIGVTRRRTDRWGWITDAHLDIAVHDSAGHAFTPSALVGIVRHEVGHALGLGHSQSSGDIMYFEETTHDISATDRATLRLLYTLPPGSVK